MLSSRTASTRTVSASSSCSSVSTSTWIGKSLPSLSVHGHCGRDRTGDGDVVVLDEDSVVEPRAVIDAAAGLDGVFLEETQARRRLARVLDDGAGALDRAHDGGRRGGDAGEVAEQIQDHAFAAQERARGDRRAGDRAAGLDVRSIRRDDRGARRFRQPESTSLTASTPAMRPASRLRMTAVIGVPEGTMEVVVMSPRSPRSSASALATMRASASCGASRRQATWLRVTVSVSSGARAGTTKLRAASSARGAGWSLR